MISDDAGGSENVNGNRIAMVVIGAMPGSTPTSVPISAPRKQKPIFAGDSATEKPVARLAIRSMSGLSPRPYPDRQAEHADEQDRGERRERQRRNGVFPHPHVIGRVTRANDDHEAGDSEADERQQDRKQHYRRRQQQEWTRLNRWEGQRA